jgi:hypothetical protein
MSAAIAALLATLAVIYGLSVTATTSQPVETYLNVLLGMVRNTGRTLTADEAGTAIFYALLGYLVVFSISFFFLRFVGIMLLALGFPDEAALRARRDFNRSLTLQRRQARLNAQYIVRAQMTARKRASFLNELDNEL